MKGNKPTRQPFPAKKAKDEFKGLYLVRRVDENCGQCYGTNLSMVICAETRDQIEEMISKYLLLDEVGMPVKRHDGFNLERSDITITGLGIADGSLQVGVVHIHDAGA